MDKHYSKKAEGKEEFTCDVCERVLTTKQGLKLHLQSHFREKLYKCNICKKSSTHRRVEFVLEKDLNYHMVIKHGFHPKDEEKSDHAYTSLAKTNKLVGSNFLNFKRIAWISSVAKTFRLGGCPKMSLEIKIGYIREGGCQK